MTVFLAFVGLLAVVNPPRRSLELSPHPALRIAAAAGVLVLAVLVGCAALSGPLLDWLDVSVPTMRIAAGLVVGIRALIELVLVPKPEPEGLTGWGEAFFPVAIPVLLRPETAVLAIAAGADVGVAWTGLAALVAVAIGVTAVSSPTPARPARVVGVFSTVAAIVVGVALVVDGVLDI